MKKFAANENENIRSFRKCFENTALNNSPHAVWCDFIKLSAISISAAFDIGTEKGKKRAEEFEHTWKRYSEKDRQRLTEMFELTVEALENNPEQDFLGDIFMRLKLGNVFNGQFFTPYHLSALTAETMREAVLERLEEEAYISVNDPACGAGALLIAYRNMLKNAGVDWSGKAIFAAQDIDETTALMCYTQLSLLGCAGYVCIADSLRYPMTGDPLIPQIGKNQDYWFTPAYFSDVWTWRKMEALCR